MFEYDRGNYPRPSSAPADDVYMITPHDTNLLPQTVRAIRIAVAGDIRIMTAAGNDRTLTVLAEEVLLCGATRVYSTGTTATGLLGYV